jgi:hypothetical protein
MSSGCYIHAAISTQGKHRKMAMNTLLRVPLTFLAQTTKAKAGGLIVLVESGAHHITGKLI